MTFDQFFTRLFPAKIFDQFLCISKIHLDIAFGVCYSYVC